MYDTGFVLLPSDTEVPAKWIKIFIKIKYIYGILTIW